MSGERINVQKCQLATNTSWPTLSYISAYPHTIIWLLRPQISQPCPQISSLITRICSFSPKISPHKLIRPQISSGLQALNQSLQTKNQLSMAWNWPSKVQNQASHTSNASNVQGLESAFLGIWSALLAVDQHSLVLISSFMPLIYPLPYLNRLPKGNTRVCELL